MAHRVMTARAVATSSLLPRATTTVMSTTTTAAAAAAATTTALCVSRRGVTLQSEKPCATLADKVVRDAPPTSFYTHPSYVMAREKMLYTLWVDIGVFATCIYPLLAYFTLAYFFKA